jgi:5-methylcytosine-specific restriction protein A
MSASRVMPGGIADRRALPRGPNGRTLCRWCSLEVPKGRLTFCSEWCVNEWRLRTNPGYLRDQVLARDKGICAECKIDTISEWNHLKRLRYAKRSELLRQKWGLNRMTRASLWDADHIVPVVEGGGECDLSNIRTLCVKCHRKATATLRQRIGRKASVDCG